MFWIYSDDDALFLSNKNIRLTRVSPKTFEKKKRAKTTQKYRRRLGEEFDLLLVAGPVEIRFVGFSDDIISLSFVHIILLM